MRMPVSQAICWCNLSSDGAQSVHACIMASIHRHRSKLANGCVKFGKAGLTTEFAKSFAELKPSLVRLSSTNSTGVSSVAATLAFSSFTLPKPGSKPLSPSMMTRSCCFLYSTYLLYMMSISSSVWPVDSSLAASLAETPDCWLASCFILKADLILHKQ